MVTHYKDGVLFELLFTTFSQIYQKSKQVSKSISVEMQLVSIISTAQHSHHRFFNLKSKLKILQFFFFKNLKCTWCYGEEKNNYSKIEKILTSNCQRLKLISTVAPYALLQILYWKRFANNDSAFCNQSNTSFLYTFNGHVNKVC